MENTRINIGNCGEYFVAAELERRGFTVAVPMSNTPSFDILAIKNDDHNKQYAIQVKTTKGNKTKLGVKRKKRIHIRKQYLLYFRGFERYRTTRLLHCSERSCCKHG